jgi:hypothetical protein
VPRYKRIWTTDDVKEMIVRHVAGESNVAIGKALGCDDSTVSRYLRHRDSQAIIEEERAKIDHAARAEREAVAKAEKEAKRRERNAARMRQSRAQAKRADDVARAQPSSSEGGHVLGVLLAGGEGAGLPQRWIPNRSLERARTGETSAQELDRLERKLVPKPVSVEFEERDGSISLLTFDVLDESDIWRAGRVIRDAGVSDNLNALVEHLSRAGPGQTLRIFREAPDADE